MVYHYLNMMISWQSTITLMITMDLPLCLRPAVPGGRWCGHGTVCGPEFFGAAWIATKLQGRVGNSWDANGCLVSKYYGLIFIAHKMHMYICIYIVYVYINIYIYIDIDLFQRHISLYLFCIYDALKLPGYGAERICEMTWWGHVGTNMPQQLPAVWRFSCSTCIHDAQTYANTSS